MILVYVLFRFWQRQKAKNIMGQVVEAMASEDKGAYSTPIEPVLGDIDALVIPERDPADPEFDTDWPEDISLETFNSQVSYYDDAKK